MIRLSIAAVAILSLAACGSGTKADNKVDSANAGAPAAAPAATGPAANASGNVSNNAQVAVVRTVPANFDWAFDLHGGSAQMIFGDGDIAEGENLLSFACLPGSKRTEANWNDERPATLRGGTATVDLQPNASLPLDHPVLQSLRSGGELVMVKNGQEQRLSARAAGKAVIADFFDYCSEPASQQR